MSAFGSRANDEINLDEFERRLRAAGAQQARVEDPLAELSRLVEFSRLGVSPDEKPARRSAEPAAARAEPLSANETEPFRASLDDDVEELAPGASEADRAARRDYEFATGRSDETSVATAGEERPMRWKLAVSALALAGVAMIGVVLAMRGGVPGVKKDPPFIAAAQGPTRIAPPSDQTVAASSDPGASLLKDNGKPNAVKVVNSEEQPVDLSAQAPAAPSAAAPTSAPDATALAATINTPLVAPTAQPPQGLGSEFPDPKPVRTISLRPDGTPIAAASAPDQTASAPAPAEAPSKPAANSGGDTAGVAQSSTPKIELPAKASPKSSARVVVGKTDTTAPAGAGQPPSEPAQTDAPAKPDKASAKKPKVADATETTGSIAPAVDATAATTSGGWAVQLAAPRSEAEANSELARLNNKYGAQLNGSALGIHKAVVKGETIYRLRVVGLTKADAAALCARLKGGGGECFIAK